MTIANELMIKAIGEITVNEGLNPRESVIVAGGGAAGFNIMPIARELGCATVILPRLAAALSACGMQYSDIVFEATRSRFTDTSGLRHRGRERGARGDRGGARRLPRRPDGRPRRAASRPSCFVEARYRAQVWELDTPLPAPRIGGAGGRRRAGRGLPPGA